MSTTTSVGLEGNLEQLASKAATEWTGLHGQLGTDEEQRRFVRNDYFAGGLIAWSDGEELPSLRSFKKVQYRDISSGGVAFAWPAAHEQNEVIVVLRKHDSVIVLKAEVVGERYDEVSSQWIIGCQFTRRIRVMNN